jgi:hypothetical protein
MDTFTICRLLREAFPVPVNKRSVSDRADYLADELATEQTLADAWTALTAHWERKGWSIAEKCAVFLDDHEEALEHGTGITIIRVLDGDLEGQVAVLGIETNSPHPKVIWF